MTNYTGQCETLSSPDTFQVLLNRYVFQAWNTTLKSTVLGLPDLAWSIQVKFLEPSAYGIVTDCDFTFYTTNVFVCFCDILVQFKFVKHKLPN